MARLLGIDVGTTGAKVVLIDERGTVLRTATAAYPLHTPRPGWAEQDPLDWKNAVHQCLLEIGERRPDAIGVTGQMHGLVCLDATDQVVRPAILWCDQRTAAECDEIDATLGADMVRSTTGNPPLTGFQAPKLLWMRNNEIGEFASAKSVLLPKDYARFVLTGERATDVSDASGTGVFDVNTRSWWQRGIEGLGLDARLFPQALESDKLTGRTLASDALEPGVPVVAGAGDQAAGAVGTGAVESGVVSVSLGTSGVVFSSLQSPDADPSGAAHVFCHANRAWHAMGVVLSCGGAVRWVRDLLYPGEGFDLMNKEAASAPVGSQGATFLPYLSGERCPHNDPRATACFAGMSLINTRPDLARATFEGTTFGLKECLDRLVGLGVQCTEVRVTGGGAKSDFWMQMIADVFQVPCTRMRADEGPAFGAALLAGVGAGVWRDVQAACSQTVETAEAFEPSGSDYSEALDRYQRLYPQTRAWTVG